MRDSMIATPIDPVAEAQRYVQNAKDLLNQNGKLDFETKAYGDRKYVRMAGNTLWNGVLYILDTVFHVSKNKRTRPDIDDYQRAVSQRDRKLLTLINRGYDTMHLAMGYDGNLDKSVCDAGFRLANDIIDLCAIMLGR